MPTTTTTNASPSITTALPLQAQVQQAAATLARVEDAAAKAREDVAAELAAYEAATRAADVPAMIAARARLLPRRDAATEHARAVEIARGLHALALAAEALDAAECEVQAARDEVSFAHADIEPLPAHLLGQVHPSAQRYPTGFREQWRMLARNQMLTAVSRRDDCAATLDQAHAAVEHLVSTAVAAVR